MSEPENLKDGPSCSAASCSCQAHRPEEEEHPYLIPRMLTAATLWALARFVLQGQVQTFVYAAAYLIIGYDVVVDAVEGLAHGRWTDEKFLMALASVTAFFIQEADEAVMVMLLYQLGEYLSDRAVDHSKDNIEALLSQHADTVHLVAPDGSVSDVAAERVEPGMILQIRPYEQIPVDGVVKEGQSALDLSALNGESVPAPVQPGDTVLSGSVNGGELLIIEAGKSLADSTVTKIRELVENCQNEKGRTETFVERFSRYYTPTVILLAAAIAVCEPLLIRGVSWDQSVRTACTLLVVSCPCALVISVPLAYFCGIGAASRQGVLVKGAEYLENLERFDYLAMDKTGTLTTADFVVTAMDTEMDEQEFLKLAASLESFSNHPLAKAIVREYGEDGEKLKVTYFREEPGLGVQGHINGKHYYLGSYSYISRLKLPEVEKVARTAIYLAEKDRYLGRLEFADQIKPEARETIEALKQAGVKKMVVFSGDKQEKVDQLKDTLPLDETWGELMPEGKVEKLREAQQAGYATAFVGDGTNDAAVLASADVGIAMGLKGTDTAITSSDIVLMHDDLKGLLAGRKIARRTVSIVKQNIWFIVICKALFIILGVAQMIPMWAAVFADVGVTLICVLNAMRLFTSGKRN